MQHDTYQQGYVTVMSAIIITTILLVVALTFSSSSFMGRFDTQAVEFKILTRNLAQGCIAHAQLMLALGSYTGNEDVVVGAYTCHVVSVTQGSGIITVQVTAIIEDHTTNLEAVLNSTTLAINSVIEVSTFE